MKEKIIPSEPKIFEIVKSLCPHHGYDVDHKMIPNPFEGCEDIKRCVLCATKMEELEQKEKEEAIKKTAQKKQQQINRNLLNAAIAPRFADTTLDNYKTPHPDQVKALETIRWFLDNLDNSVGLIIIGDPSTGKNHLATGIVKEVIKKGKTALLTKLRKIDRMIKETYRTDEKESDVLKSLAEVDLLVIDEVGRQRDTKDEVLHIEELIDDRYELMKPTVLVGNVTLQELENYIGSRSYARFEKARGNGRVIVCNWPKWKGV